MGERVVIGLDVGTTSTKTGAYELDGSSVATAQVETMLHRSGPGAVEQDPHELLESAFTTVGRCVERAGVGPAPRISRRW